MKIIPQSIPEVVLFEPKVFGDERGFFFESFQAERYQPALGGSVQFVQDNVSFSERGTLRGLHFQHPFAQGKLVQVLKGAVFDVAVDIRLHSPTFGRCVWVELDDVEHKQLYIPPGFAHGFQVISESALFYYKCTEFYKPDAEASLRWDDPELAIPWPLSKPNLSRKDQEGQTLEQLRLSKRLPDGAPAEPLAGERPARDAPVGENLAQGGRHECN